MVARRVWSGILQDMEAGLDDDGSGRWWLFKWCFSDGCLTALGDRGSESCNHSPDYGHDRGGRRWLAFG